jgi:hypothetical protein
VPLGAHQQLSELAAYSRLRLGRGPKDGLGHDDRLTVKGHGRRTVKLMAAGKTSNRRGQSGLGKLAGRLEVYSWAGTRR